MPRTFTPAELRHLTVGEYNSLTSDEKLLYARALINHWADATAKADRRYLQGDYDLIASHRRFEIGE